MYSVTNFSCIYLSMIKTAHSVSNLRSNLELSPCVIKRTQSSHFVQVSYQISTFHCCCFILQWKHLFPFRYHCICSFKVDIILVTVSNRLIFLGHFTFWSQRIEIRFLQFLFNSSLQFLNRLLRLMQQNFQSKSLFPSSLSSSENSQ